MRKKKLQELEQINGKLEQNTEKYQPHTLDQLWGATSINRYGITDVEEYKSQLAEMNTASLREHAVKLGIMPTPERDRLVKRLLIEFQRHVGSYQKPILKVPKQPKKIDPQVLKILAEAK